MYTWELNHAGLSEGNILGQKKLLTILFITWSLGECWVSRFPVTLLQMVYMVSGFSWNRLIQWPVSSSVHNQVAANCQEFQTELSHQEVEHIDYLINGHYLSYWFHPTTHVQLFVLCDRPGESSLQKDCCWWLTLWLHEMIWTVFSFPLTPPNLDLNSLDFS